MASGEVMESDGETYELRAAAKRSTTAGHCR
jgi:hypothetical protein